MFSVELLLDPATEQAVRDEWARLIAAGLPSAGRQTAESNRPHVTLAVREGMDASAFAPLGSVARALPFALDLGGVLLFGHGDRFVVARQVVVSAALLDLHRRVATIVGPAEPKYSVTAPDHWTPHVTLARRVDASQVAEVLSILAPHAIEGQAAGLRVWDAAASVVTRVR